MVLRGAVTYYELFVDALWLVLTKKASNLHVVLAMGKKTLDYLLLSYMSCKFTYRFLFPDSVYSIRGEGMD